MRYDRAAMVDVLVYHYRVAPGKGCGCGWNQIGLSWADHVADVYEETVIKGLSQQEIWQKNRDDTERRYQAAKARGEA